METEKKKEEESADEIWEEDGRLARVLSSLDPNTVCAMAAAIMRCSVNIVCNKS
jgi:hypothetical protein